MSYSTMAQLNGTCKPEKHRTDFDKKQLEFYSECMSCNKKNKHNHNSVKENFEGDYNDMYKVLSGFSKSNQQEQDINENQQDQENQEEDDNDESFRGY